MRSLSHTISCMVTTIYVSGHKPVTVQIPITLHSLIPKCLNCWHIFISSLKMLFPYVLSSSSYYCDSNIIIDHLYNIISIRWHLVVARRPWVTKIFERSVQKYNVRYIEYLEDGDSNGLASVVTAQPYGTDVSIKKLECIEHVQKRMGSRIKTYADKNKGEKLSDGKALSGKNHLNKKIHKN